MPPDYTLYDTAIAKMDEYKEAENTLNQFVECEKPLGRAYASWDEKIKILTEHQKLIKTRDKAKRAFESADKKWKRYYAQNKGE